MLSPNDGDLLLNVNVSLFAHLVVKYASSYVKRCAEKVQTNHNVSYMLFKVRRLLHLQYNVSPTMHALPRKSQLIQPRLFLPKHKIYYIRFHDEEII